MIGVIEREIGTLYCTVLFFGPDGALLGKHCKLMPTAMERLIWGFGDGSTMPVFNTPLGKLGAVVCWENLHAAVAHRHVREGDSTLLRSHGGRPRNLDAHHAPHRARGPLFRALGVSVHRVDLRRFSHS